MTKKLFPIAILLIMGGMFFLLINEVKSLKELPKVSKIYAATAAEDLGSQNIVTSVITVYRGLDTLGEVSVLFIVSAAIGFLTRRDGKKEIPIRKASELLETAASFLVPLIILFGVYIFLHGHLTPGGGFQGGVIMAYAIIMLLLTNVSRDLNHSLIHSLESFSGLTYVLIGAAGIVLAGGFFDSRVLPNGSLGDLLSAGTIPIVYSLIGIKVGSELVGIIDNMRKG